MAIDERFFEQIRTKVLKTINALSIRGINFLNGNLPTQGELFYYDGTGFNPISEISYNLTNKQL